MLIYLDTKPIYNINSLIHIMINALIMISSGLVIDNHSKFKFINL